MLLEHRVGAGGDRSTVQGRVRVPGQHDQAEIRTVVPQPSHRGDPVQERHVQVDDRRVRVELRRELDRLKSVAGSGNDRQLGLPVDQRPERLEEKLVVVCQ